jgi:hypothetical protein
MHETGELEYPIAVGSALVLVDLAESENIAADPDDSGGEFDGNVPTEQKEAAVVGGIWLKETGTCAPILGIRIHNQLYFGFKAKQKFGKSPDYNIFEHSSAGAMVEAGCLWVTNILPGKQTKDGEKLLIRLRDDYLFAVRPAPVKVKKLDGSETVKAPSRKEPTFLVLAVAPSTALVPFPKGVKGGVAVR